MCILYIFWLNEFFDTTKYLLDSSSSLPVLYDSADHINYASRVLNQNNIIYINIYRINCFQIYKSNQFWTSPNQNFLKTGNPDCTIIIPVEFLIKIIM